MSTPITSNLTTRQQQHFAFSVFGVDGAADPDNTQSPGVAVSSDPTIASITMDTNGRGFTIVAQSAGQCIVDVSTSGRTESANAVSVSVINAPDLRHLDLTAGTVAPKP